MANGCVLELRSLYLSGLISSDRINGSDRLVKLPLSGSQESDMGCSPVPEAEVQEFCGDGLLLGADSTGRCNGLAESFSGRFVVKCLPGAGV